jgi:hypothetical protein
MTILKFILACLALIPVLAFPVGTGVFVREAFLGGSPALEAALFSVVLTVLLVTLYLVRSWR